MNVHMHRMNSNGAVGARIADYKWSEGWTKAEPFTVGAQNYLFLLKKGNGIVHVHKLIEVSWNEEYGYGRINAAKAVLEAKSEIAVGSIGCQTSHYNWTKDWSTVELYKAGGNTCLFLLKHQIEEP